MRAMKKEEPKLKKFAVFGNPVAHSKSPRIHALFAHQFKHPIEYTAIEAPSNGLKDALDAFRDQGGFGANVTVPFKLDAYELAENVSERAKVAQAVNTIRFEKDGTLFGDNTDGIGLVYDLTRNLGVPIKGKKILLLGAGGAVRGVLAPTLKHHPQEVWVANRTADKAQELAKEFSSLGKVQGTGYDELRGKRFDVVINGTSASLSGELPPLPENLFANQACAYDMMYGEKARPFLNWASVHGAAKIADGLGMLVEQAAESYFVWQGVRPETRSVIAQLSKEV
jgi:shikimate dehydrogenase